MSLSLCFLVLNILYFYALKRKKKLQMSSALQFFNVLHFTFYKTSMPSCYFSPCVLLPSWQINLIWTFYFYASIFLSLLPIIFPAKNVTCMICLFACNRIIWFWCLTKLPSGSHSVSRACDGFDQLLWLWKDILFYRISLLKRVT